MSGLAKHLIRTARRWLRALGGRHGLRPGDHARDRARIRKALGDRLSAHLLKDVGGDEG